MLSLRSGAAALLLLARPADVARVQVQMSKDQDQPAIGWTSVDLEEYLQQSDISEKVKQKGLKCCCDGYGTRFSHKWYSNFHTAETINARTRRCVLEPVAKCSSIDPKPEWAKLSLSSAANAEQNCTVDEPDAKKYYRDLGSPSAYCKAPPLPERRAGAGETDPFKEAGSIQKAGKLERPVTVKCAPGYRPVQRESTCKYGNGEAGQLDPQPACEMRVHCPAVSAGDGEDGAEVPAAGCGLSVAASCAAVGWEPVEATTTCQRDTTFLPKPACRKTPAFCKGGTANALGSPTVEDSVIGEAQKVTCAPGWETDVTTTCTAEGLNGTFDPEPAGCAKIKEYCPTAELDSHDGMPFIWAGEIGSILGVYCIDSEYMINEAVKPICGEDRKPHFDASLQLCIKKDK